MWISHAGVSESDHVTCKPGSLLGSQRPALLELMTSAYGVCDLQVLRRRNAGSPAGGRITLRCRTVVVGSAVGCF